MTGTHPPLKPFHTKQRKGGREANEEEEQIVIEDER